MGVQVLPKACQKAMLRPGLTHTTDSLVKAREEVLGSLPVCYTCGCRRRQGVVLFLFHELQGHSAEIALILNYKVTQSHHQLLLKGRRDNYVYGGRKWTGQPVRKLINT